MSKIPKKLAKAWKHTNELPADWFGTDQATMEDLPSVRRSRRVRKNIFIEKETADALEQFCKTHHVPFTEIANDILTKYVEQRKKKVG